MVLQRSDGLERGTLDATGLAQLVFDLELRAEWERRLYRLSSPSLATLAGDAMGESPSAALSDYDVRRAQKPSREAGFSRELGSHDRFRFQCLASDD